MSIVVFAWLYGTWKLANLVWDWGYARMIPHNVLPNIAYFLFCLVCGTAFWIKSLQLLKAFLVAMGKVQ